ncbi:hypothetical protein [Hyalangium rubrum]|uniref:Lipase modulator n=1 Tax=Hyalangium rubrum TaxID=3103134 RepID=A0ABU5HB95_9BACT|nr:hypothetical protein [Hyalangium sp. s54d21]MDY7230364.1 hypothetical protein [Hyalangium sp. s54d21]
MSLTHRIKLPLVLGALVLVAAVLFALLNHSSPETTPIHEAKGATTPAPAPSVPAPSSVATPGRIAVPDPNDSLAKLLEVPPAESTQEQYPDSPLKIEELRARLPDNLYWKRDAPTTDPEVLRQRDEEARQWNTVFGKVQVGEATEEEIQRYYDYRRKISEDYIEMGSLMLTEYRDRLPERDQGLIELSIRMHRDRLAEVPRQLSEAQERKKLLDQRREEWRRTGKAP